jgi:hypothetical protein
MTPLAAGSSFGAGYRCGRRCGFKPLGGISGKPVAVTAVTLQQAPQLTGEGGGHECAVRQISLYRLLQHLVWSQEGIEQGRAEVYCLSGTRPELACFMALLIVQACAADCLSLAEGASIQPVQLMSMRELIRSTGVQA